MSSEAEAEAEAYYAEMAERQAYEDAVAARDAGDWRHLIAERDTHAETLRVLLVREARCEASMGRDCMAAARSLAYNEAAAAHRRTRAAELHAMAGIALILALMIGGE